MKRAIGFTFLTLMALSLIQILSPRLEAQSQSRNKGNQPQEGVCFYTDENYKGENFCVSSNESLRNIGDRYNDRISSIRIFGRAEVTVYDDESFTGSRQTVSRNMPKLGAWNDRITSFQGTSWRQSDGQYGGQSREQFEGWGRGNEPGDGVCFYRDENYRGENFCVSSNESVRNIGDRYNDSISSIRVFGEAQVTVYDNESFNGSRQTISRDTPNLGAWGDRISSLQVTGGRQYGGQYGGLSRGQNGGLGSGNEPGDGVCFYRDENYRGENFCVSSNESVRNIGDRYNDSISSIRVFGRAQVTVYDNESFNGSRQTISRDTPNLGAWGDRITSFQVAGGSQYEGQYGGQSRGQYEVWSGGRVPRNGACFFMDADYRGDSFCMSAGDGQRKVQDRFNDGISSIRIFGRARVVVHEHESFGGASRTVTGDMSNLAGEFNDRITSIEVR